MRAAALISAAVLLSRLLALVREQLFAAMLGASPGADAYQLGFRVPSLLRDLFAEGALSQAFVPAFRRAELAGGAAATRGLAERLATWLCVAGGGLALAGALAAPWIVGWVAPDFAATPGKLDLAVTCTRIMLPFVPLVAVAAVAMGVLNAGGRFGAPSLATAAFNVATLAGAGLVWAAGVSGGGIAVGWAVATLAGGVALVLVQLPPLLRDGWRPRPRLDVRLRDAGGRRAMAAFVPSVLGVSATQINLLLAAVLATPFAGAVAHLSYAFRFLYLPIGLFGVALGTVAATRFAAAGAAGDQPGLARELTDGLRALAFLTVPATVGLVVLAEPIVRLIYQRGAFTPADTAATAALLRAFSVGLFAFCGLKLLAPAFYARGRVRVPLVAAAVTVAVFVAVALGLRVRWGPVALAAGVAAGGLVNLLVLGAVFFRDHSSEARRALAVVPGVALASAVCGGAAWLTHRGLAATAAPATLTAVLAGGLAYAAATLALGVPEARALVGRLRRGARRR